MTCHPLLARLSLTALLAAPLLAAPLHADPFAAVKISAGEALFNGHCHRCHAVDADRASYGPPLAGVLGRKAGSVADYPYSTALKGAGFVWTAGALRAWMEENDALVPGTKMRHVGITDPTVQDFIVSYLGAQ